MYLVQQRLIDGTWWNVLTGYDSLDAAITNRDRCSKMHPDRSYRIVKSETVITVLDV